MNNYTPLDPAWLKSDSKMRTEGRTSYFAIASLLGIISMSSAASPPRRRC